MIKQVIMDPLLGPIVSTLVYWPDDRGVILESSVYLGLIIDAQPIFSSCEACVNLDQDVGNCRH